MPLLPCNKCSKFTPANFLPGVAFVNSSSGVGDLECCWYGCSPNCKDQALCGCVEGEKCNGETGCSKGLCDDGNTLCSCCEPGYAKTAADSEECVFVTDSCPSECPGEANECDEGCGCQSTSIDCKDPDTGEMVSYTRSAEENTRCVQNQDTPTDENPKGFTSSQERKACCGPCITEISCPDSGGGGGDTHPCDSSECYSSAYCSNCTGNQVCTSQSREIYYQGVPYTCDCYQCEGDYTPPDGGGGDTGASGGGGGDTGASGEVDPCA